MRPFFLTALGISFLFPVFAFAGEATGPSARCRAALSASETEAKRGPASEETRAQQAIVAQLKKNQPPFTMGLTNASSVRDLFAGLFASLPLDLELPLNTASLLTLQARTGESRPGIDPVWSSSTSLSAILDLAGVFGPLSPVGFNGPVGNKTLDIYGWWKKWSDASIHMFVPREVLEKSGPLNPDTGVLSKIGPDSSDWKQGNFNVLGSNSFSGPKGILGPLGPNGAVRTLSEDYRLDKTGFYIDGATERIVSSINVPFGNHSRTYDVVEHLMSKFSEELSDKWLLDTTYLVDSHLDNLTSSKSYRSTAPQSEIVSVLVVPDIGLTSGPVVVALPKRLNFSLRVLTEQGSEIIKSDLAEKSNLVQFQVRRGEKFEVQVLRQGLGAWGTTQRFRLIVIGSTAQYAVFLWQRVMGAEFTRLFEAPKTFDNELALAYLFAEVSRRSFADFKAVLRDGKPFDEANPESFWKKVMADTMADYRKLEAAAKTPAELRAALLAAFERSVAGYRDAVTRQPLSADEIVKMWRLTIGTTAASAEKIHSLDKSTVAKVPAAWIAWMEDALKFFKRGSSAR